MPVVDASVLVEYLARGEAADAAEQTIETGNLIAPHLIDAEVGHALRRLAAARRLAAEDAEQALLELSDLPMTRASHQPLLMSAWHFRGNVSFYDAIYLALAQELDAELATFDARLARAAKGTGIAVEVLPASDKRAR